jgi:hypothetical protein
LLAAGGTFAGLHLSDDGPVWVLVGLDRWVGPSPEAQAAWTWRLLLAVGLGWAALAWWRSAPEGSPDAASDG